MSHKNLIALSIHSSFTYSAQLSSNHITLSISHSTNMRASFFIALVLASTLVSGAPLDTRANNSPTFGKGGNAQSGHSGNVNGGDVANQGGFVLNGAFASTLPSFQFQDWFHRSNFTLS